MFVLVPSAPPQSVTAGVLNATSAWIRWEPPPVNTWNGELTGYLVSFAFNCLLVVNFYEKVFEVIKNKLIVNP